MLGKNRHDWTAVPEKHVLADLISRQALLAKLDRRAALTIIRAPNGHGKSSLLASWLRASLVSERIVVWISAPDGRITADEYWAAALHRLHDVGIALPSGEVAVDPFTAVTCALERAPQAVLLVLIRPDLTQEPRLDEQLIEILARCHDLDIVVTLSGFVMFPEPYLLDTDHEVIVADELLFTTADTARLLESADARALPNDARRITALTGGLPALVRAAIAAVKGAPRGGNREQVIDRNIARAIDKYVDGSVLATADLVEQRKFLLANAFARTITVDIAALLFPSSPPATAPQLRARLIALEAAGVLSRIDTEIEEGWALQPAIRRSILGFHLRAGVNPSQHLSFLAYNQLHSGHHASALDYAVEAQNWTLAVDIIEQHWVTMIVNDLDTVRSALRHIPAEAADKHPIAESGRALFVKYHTEQDNSTSVLPESPAELYALGAGAQAKVALTIGCVQSLALIHAGAYARAENTTRRLIIVSGSALENNPEEISSELPVMRAQWAVTYQLTGKLAESTSEARLAYRSAVSEKIDFVARNAAGIIAMNWAMVGEPNFARYWLEREDEHRDSNGWAESVVKIAGLTARTLTSLDLLAVDDARSALAELGRPTESEELWAQELWAFIVHAHCQLALAGDDVFAALSLLHRTVAARTEQCNATSFALPLMRSAEIDLLLASGEGNKASALALAIVDPSSNPWTLVSVARLRQRTGQNEAALALCQQFDWTRDSYPRAQLESLLVQAVAHLELGEPRLAVQAWSQACTIADHTGIVRSFSTIASADIETLESEAQTNSTSLATFLSAHVAESFPKHVHTVTLTEREQKVLSLLVQGMSSTAIADKLYVSVNTVKTQLRTLYKKLDAHNRGEATTRAHAMQLI